MSKTHHDGWTEVEFYITAEDGQDVEREFWIKAKVHPGEAAKLWGHPDDQHPGTDPEVDDVRVYRDEKFSQLVDSKEYANLGIDTDLIDELAIEQANEQAEADSQDYDEREED